LAKVGLRHEADVSRAGVRHATCGMDMITFDDPPSILFVSAKRVATPKFVELAHTLNHLQKLHCVIVDEAHLVLSNFRPVMKRLLPLWAVGCQLVALTASLSPSQETNFKIVMSARFAVVQMSTVRPVATPLWPSVGVKPNTSKVGLGVLRDSRMFRARQQGPKHLALGRSWCHWKGLEM